MLTYHSPDIMAFMPTLAYILIATTLVSLISLIGVVTLAIKAKSLEKSLNLMIALAAGSLMGGSFFHLLPEAAEKLDIERVLTATLFSFVLFLIIEKILHWRHCHHHHCEVHTLGTMSIIGDSLHNLIDGLVIAAAFLGGVELGIATTIAIALHEIPQEIGDFGILLHAGYKKRTALLVNFATALTAVFGAVVGFIINQSTPSIIPYLLPLAAGGFIYIGASDLLPEIRKEQDRLKSSLSFIFFLIGIGAMYLLKFVELG